MLLPIGMALVALGLIGIIFGIFQKMKAGRVTDAPFVSTGDVGRRGREAAGPKGQISAQGSVVCQQPLIAPFSGQPCLYYEIKCTAKWKAGDSHKSEVIDQQKVAAQFAIDDGTGPVWIDAREGGDFTPSQRKSETKGAGLLGGLTGSEIVFGNYRVNTPMLDMGTKYEVEEEVFPLVPRVYACGRLGDQPGVIAAPSWRQLLLAASTRDELLAAATKTAKIALFAGLGLFVVGSALATIGQLRHKSDDEKVAAAASSTPNASATDSAPLPIPPPVMAPSASTDPAATASAPATKPAKKKKKKK